MSLLRCFIAIELPAAIRSRISAATAVARSRLGDDVIRWVPAENVHVTLKFLGDTATTSVELIRAAIAAEARQFVAFDVDVVGFGAFPDARKPRVLWVGLSAPPALASLQRVLDAATGRLGYASDERGFSPHLTVGRLRQNVTASALRRVRDELDRASVGNLGSFTVAEINLYKSELSPSGPRYTSLIAVPLGAG
jgi:2'-5' RNA ligase